MKEDEIPDRQDDTQVDCTHELYGLYLHLDGTWLKFTEKGGNGEEEDKNSKEPAKVLFKVVEVNFFNADCPYVSASMLQIGAY